MQRQRRTRYESFKSSRLAARICRNRAIQQETGRAVLQSISARRQQIAALVDVDRALFARDFVDTLVARFQPIAQEAAHVAFERTALLLSSRRLGPLAGLEAHRQTGVGVGVIEPVV